MRGLTDLDPVNRYSDASSTLREKNFVYDKLGRLSTDTWIHPNPDEEYKFTDTDTQFLSKIEKTVSGSTTTVRDFTKATDGSLQLTAYSDPTTSCSHDIAGNCTVEGSTSFYYDSENRIPAVSAIG